MVEKIIIDPQKVRGLGNIVMEKDSKDFENYMCAISESTETINGALESIFIIEDVFGSLYFDQCNNTSNLGNYGNSIHILAFQAVASLTYDDTVEAYKLSGNGNYMAMIPIIPLNDMDGYTIEADFKAQNIQNDKVGFCLKNRNGGATQQCFYFSIYDGKFTEAHFGIQEYNYSHQDTTVDITDDKWYHMKMSFEDGVFAGELYDGDTLLASSSNVLQVDNKQIGLLLDCRNSTSDNAAYVKNIKVTPYTAPVSNYTLEFSQSTYYIPFLEEGVNVSCTLTDNGTPVSGQTITFNWEESGLPASTTATTNSNGVATTFIYTTGTTLTAIYQTASATCTIEEEGF